MTDMRTRPETEPTTPDARRPRLLTYGITSAALLIAAAAAGVWWLFGGDAPDEVDAQAALEATGERTSLEVGEIGGTWQVVHDEVAYDFDAGTGTFVGFRIDEELAIGGATTAVGRTPEVDGSFVVDGTELTSATVAADMTALVTDEARRDDSVQEALETEAYPEAVFELTETVDLGEVPQIGDQLEVTVSGAITVRDITRAVQVPLGVAFVSDELALITGSRDVALPGHDIVLPSVPLVLSVENEATVEMQLFVTRADG